MPTFKWQDVGDSPKEPGIYAWYYSPELTNHDIERLTSEIEQLKAGAEPTMVRSAIRELLNDLLFKPFQEQPYTAQLIAPLRPRYEGTLEHKTALTDNLVERIIEQPELLRFIREALNASAPNFSSPMYIGMSENLRERLTTHKRLIERLAERSTSVVEADGQSHSFASEIISRRIPYTKLFVIVRPIPGASKAAVTIENILNRIHFPILGRN